MTKEDVWNLFKMTGKLEYYLKYQEMIKGRSEKLGGKED
jgi:hypothetical protein